MAKKKKNKPQNLEATTEKKNIKTVKVSTKRPSVLKNSKTETSLIFGRENYKWVGIGLALIAIGMLLMIGGFNENPNEWDESSIYSMRRILLAPIVILTGLGVQIYAIFK